LIATGVKGFSDGDQFIGTHVHSFYWSWANTTATLFELGEDK